MVGTPLTNMTTIISADLNFAEASALRNQQERDVIVQNLLSG
jgi:hypothetical protein